MDKGPFQVNVDQKGRATLTGRAGIVSFSGDKALREIGAQVKSVSISFSNGGNGTVNYMASFSFPGKVASIHISGSFNIEKLITSCSGLLCQAARAAQDRNRVHDIELQKIMGR